MLAHRQNNSATIYRLCGLLVALLIIVSQMGSLVAAQSEDLFPEPRQCGGLTDLTYSTTSTLPAGQLYVKTNAVGLKTPITLYLEDLKTNECRKVGKVNANDETWTQIGSVGDQYDSTPVNIVIASPYIGANAYASVATVLSAPKSVCKVGRECISEYSDIKGALEPTTLSQANELVTVQAARAIGTASLKRVEYYDGGDFLYANNTIQAVNRNYLRGGDRTVKKVVIFDNGQKFTITETIAMAKDPLYSQYLRSSFYRLSGQVKVFIALFGLVAIIGVSLLIYRWLRARRTYRTGHGIEQYLKTHQS